MFNRPLLKSRARTVLSRAYPQAFAVTAIYTVISAIAGYIFRIRFSPAAAISGGTLGVIIFAAVILVAFAAINFAVSVFLTQPLSLGIYKLHLDFAKGGFSDIGALGFSFRSNYKNITLTLFVKNLILTLLSAPPYICGILCVAATGIKMNFAGINLDALAYIPRSLFSLQPLLIISAAAYLLFIPLLIKLYDWRLVEFILAEDPDIRPRDALSKSKALMRSNRFAAFKLDLSFIGWLLLGSLMCGIGTILVKPYTDATNAQLYLELTGKSDFNAGENFYTNV